MKSLNNNNNNITTTNNNDNNNSNYNNYNNNSHFDRMMQGRTRDEAVLASVPVPYRTIEAPILAEYQPKTERLQAIQVPASTSETAINSMTRIRTNIHVSFLIH